MALKGGEVGQESWTGSDKFEAGEEEDEVEEARQVLKRRAC